MLRIKLLIISLLAFTIQANACDFCTMLDYGNINNKSFVRFDYRFARYKNYNQSLVSPLSGTSVAARQGIAAHRGIPGSDKVYLNSEDDYEQFVSANLLFNYMVKEKYNLTINIPYMFNTDYYGKIIQDIGAPISETNKFSGLGDISVGIQRVFTVEKEKMKHTFKLGGNLFLPTGKYEVTDIFNDNLHMQPGRSIYAMDFMGSYNIEEVGFWGVNTVLYHYKPFNKQSFGNNSYSYEYSKKYAFDVNWYKIFLGKLQKAVVLGVKNEVNSTEYINGYEIEDTGYYMLYGNIAATVTKNRFLVKAETNLPIFQSLNGLQLKNQAKFNLSVMYYLSSPKKE